MEKTTGGSGYSVEVDQVSAGEWGKIIGSFDDSVIYQTWPWGEVRWGRKNLSHLVLLRNSETVAAAQCWVLKLPIIARGIAFCKCGPLWKKGDGGNAALYEDELNLFIQAMKREYAKRRGLLLRLMVNATDGNGADMARLLTAEGFVKCRSSAPYRTIVLDLAHSEMDLKKATRPQWLSTLRKAEKNAFTIVQGDDDAMFDSFAAIYEETVYRKKFKDRLNLGDLRRINTLLPDSGKVKIILCTLDGEVLSGVLVCPTGKTAVVLFSANSAKGLELHASQYVWWQTACILREEGVLWLDLGGIDPDACPGTYRFKKGFAGALGRDTTFEQYEYCSTLSSKAVTLIADSWRKWADHPGNHLKQGS